MYNNKELRDFDLYTGLDKSINSIFFSNFNYKIFVRKRKTALFKYLPLFSDIKL